jgi:hypothetical protein
MLKHAHLYQNRLQLSRQVVHSSYDFGELTDSEKVFRSVVVLFRISRVGFSRWELLGVFLRIYRVSQ